MGFHLAQVNVGRLRAPKDDPLVAEFMDALDHVNAIADAAPGFVWRLQTEAGNATDIQPTDDEFVLINMSVWESVETLADFVYRSAHTPFLRRRPEWFERYPTSHLALWWIPAGHLPTVEEAFERLAHLDANGPTVEAFTFAKRFPPPDPAGVARLEPEPVFSRDP